MLSRNRDTVEHRLLRKSEDSRSSARPSISATHSPARSASHVSNRRRETRRVCRLSPVRSDDRSGPNLVHPRRSHTSPRRITTLRPRTPPDFGPSVTSHFHRHFGSSRALTGSIGSSRPGWLSVTTRAVRGATGTQAKPIGSSWITKLNPGGSDDGSFGLVGT